MAITIVMCSFIGGSLSAAFSAIFSHYQISGSGMQNTLNDGQDILVNKIVYLFHEPDRGDIVMLHDPTDSNRTWIKRIIGLPDDTITLTGNSVTVNGVRLTEPYVTAEYNSVSETIKIPSGKYFVLGDNRRVSKDSRSFGFVPRGDIVGQVIVIRFPLETGLGLCIGVVFCLFLVGRYRRAKK